MKISSTRVGVGIDVLGLRMGVTLYVYLSISECLFDHFFYFIAFKTLLRLLSEIIEVNVYSEPHFHVTGAPLDGFS
jgi:hypothetical protein